jgi:hypothetical protein
MEPNLSHSQAAAQKALEEGGAIGTVGKKHFHVYVHAKGVFWREAGVREVAVKAFLLEVQWLQKPEDPARTPTWFTPEAAKAVLASRREAKYGAELHAVIDRAMGRIGAGVSGRVGAPQRRAN